METKPVTGDRVGDYRQVVSASGAATVFHTWEWLSTVEDVFGYPRRHRIVYSDGTPVAVMPGFKVPELCGWSILNPFCSYGQPLVVDEIPLPDLLDSIPTGVVGAHILKDSPWSGVQGYNQAGYGAIETGVTVRQSLTDGSRGELSTAVRRALDIANDRDVRIRTGTVTEYYRLYRKTMARLGSPVFPREFFELLRDRVQSDLLVATSGETVVAGVFRLDGDAHSVLWNNASLKQYWDVRPNYLLYVRAMERAVQAGQSLVDFGRSRHGSGVHQFKTNFGGIEWPLYSFVRPPHRTPRASTSQYSRFQSVTRRASPVLTHRRVGPQVKRFIHE